MHNCDGNAADDVKIIREDISRFHLLVELRYVFFLFDTKLNFVQYIIILSFTCVYKLIV